MRPLLASEMGRHSPESFSQAAKHPLVLVLHNLRSMHNVGSLFRTADGFGIEAIHLCGYTPRPPHRDIHKTALGATETVAWQGFERTEDSLAQLHNRGYALYAAEQTTASVLLPAFAPAANGLALVLGNEVEGVPANLLALLDGALEIPQYGTKHSLNVSVAAGIFCYALVEAMRQKGL